MATPGARIKLSQELFNSPNSTASFQWAQENGKAVLHITIIPDPTLVAIVDTDLEVTDPVIQKGFRDAVFGDEMYVDTVNLASEQLVAFTTTGNGKRLPKDTIAAASTVTIKADWGTKIPGTGDGVISLK